MKRAAPGGTCPSRRRLCAPGERTFYRVKVPSPPGSGKGEAKARVSIVGWNLKKAGFRELKGLTMGKTLD